MSAKPGLSLGCLWSLRKQQQAFLCTKVQILNTVHFKHFLSNTTCNLDSCASPDEKIKQFLLFSSCIWKFWRDRLQSQILGTATTHTLNFSQNYIHARILLFRKHDFGPDPIKIHRVFFYIVVHWNMQLIRSRQMTRKPTRKKPRKCLNFKNKLWIHRERILFWKCKKIRIPIWYTNGGGTLEKATF
jgi:hypothetical protein